MDANVLKAKMPFIFKQGLTRNHLHCFMLYHLCFTYIFGKTVGGKMCKSKVGERKN